MLRANRTSYESRPQYSDFSTYSGGGGAPTGPVRQRVKSWGVTRDARYDIVGARCRVALHRQGVGLRAQGEARHNRGYSDRVEANRGELPMSRCCRYSTTREIECLRCAARGNSTFETAAILAIMRRTFVLHLESANRKLGVTTTRQAIVEALRQASRGLTYHGHRLGMSRRSLPRPRRRAVGRGPVLHDRGNAAERPMGMARVVAPLRLVCIGWRCAHGQEAMRDAELFVACEVAVSLLSRCLLSPAGTERR